MATVAISNKLSKGLAEMTINVVNRSSLERCHARAAAARLPMVAR